MAPVLIQARGVSSTPIIVSGPNSQDSRVNREDNRRFVAQAQNNETRSMIAMRSIILIESYRNRTERIRVMVPCVFVVFQQRTINLIVPGGRRNPAGAGAVLARAATRRDVSLFGPTKQSSRAWKRKLTTQLTTNHLFLPSRLYIRLGNLMLPFIVALAFAVGLPLLPSSLYRALHLPALKFNFLSARHAPEQVLVSSPEPTFLLEGRYAEASLDSGGSFQYLAFPDISGPDSGNDAATAPTCMSITEEQDYPQTSLWYTINAQLLYQIAEAAIIMTLSFFVAATFFPRRYLHILLERLCITLFISRQYNLKAALSSFLQDVFSGLHRYWMENSVADGLTPKSTDNVSWLAALEVFADIAPGEYRQRDASLSLVTVSVRQDDIVPLDEADLCLEGSFSSVSSVSPAKFTKNSTLIDTKCAPLLDAPACSPNCDTISGQGPRNTSSDTGISPPRFPDAPEPRNDAPLPVSSHLRSCTESISMEDLYNSARLSAAVAVLSEPSLGAQATAFSDRSVSPHSSCDLGALENVACTMPNPDSEGSHSECISTSSSKISQSSRRRYKSDNIQVRAASCHLGDTAATLAPAKVDSTCAFWKSSPQNNEGRVETPVKESFGSGSLPDVWAVRRVIKPELADGGPTTTDAALTGIVTTPEGMLIVPASQRPDGRLLCLLSIWSPLLIWLLQSTQRD